MRTNGSSAEVIGTRVRERRRDLGLSQLDLAAIASVSQKFLSDLENGKPTVRLDAVDRVLRAVGLRVEVVGDPQ